MAIDTLALKKVVWAIDVLGGKKSSQSPMLETLRLLTQPSTHVEPVFVMSPDYLRLATEVFPGQGEGFKAELQMRLAQWGMDQKWEQLTPPKLLVADQVMLRSSVNTLVSYAKSSGADLIACTTNAKKGLSRFVLGSFAELLMAHSTVPVLMMNPRTKPVKSFKRILFAFDFSKEAEPVLVEAAKFARSLDAEFIVFHQVEAAASYPVEFRSIWPVTPAQNKELIANRKALGERWIQELASYGVRSRFVLSSKPLSVSESVLMHAAKLKIGLIALASRRGAIASTLSGSVCRQVCRGAVVPVWVLHPQKSGETGFGRLTEIGKRKS